MSRIISFAAIMFVLSATPFVDAQRPEFNPRNVARPFRPITDFPVVSAKDADLEDNELVLGVVIGGEARAYSINTLTGPSREILNDMLGGTAIAATW